MTPWFTTLPFFHFWDFKIKEVYHVIRFEKDSRYYVLRLEKDLLDDWTVTAINGRIRSKLGQSRTFAFPNFIDAFASFCDMAKLRYQRKYHLKSIACDALLFLCFLPFLVNTENKANKIIPRLKTNIKPRTVNFSQPLTEYPLLHQQRGFLFSKTKLE
ncbi:MAG: hypothetical protein H0T84_01340 [Tatlockia sp.]|nr:hypothetical protein [Tatlockia sp.]